MGYKAVLSDAGDILLETASDLSSQKVILNRLLEKNGVSLDVDELYDLFRPFKVLGQTIISEEDAITQFFESMGVTATYTDYVGLMPRPHQEKYLFEGVTETLETIHYESLPFIVLTDASNCGEALYLSLKRLIVTQLQERGVYNPATFVPQDYIAVCISSKDVGVKKPDVSFFRCALERVGAEMALSEILYVAHESDEIFGAAELGIDVAALNFEKEHNAADIIKRISEHNLRFKEGEVSSRIFIIDSFSEILKVVREKNETMG